MGDSPKSGVGGGREMGKRQYLGDSVYGEVGGGGVFLTTCNGLGATNSIFLEVEVYTNLKNWVDGLLKEAGDARDARDTGEVGK